MTKQEIKAVVCNIMADYGFVETEHFKESMFGPLCLYCTANYYYDENDDKKKIAFSRFFCIASNKIALFDPIHIFAVDVTDSNESELKEILLDKIEYYKEQGKMAIREIEKTLRSQFVEVTKETEYDW